MKLLKDPNLTKLFCFMFINTQCFDHFYKRFSLSFPLQALKSHVVTPNLQSLFLPKYWPHQKNFFTRHRALDEKRECPSQTMLAQCSHQDFTVDGGFSTASLLTY